MIGFLGLISSISLVSRCNSGDKIVSFNDIEVITAETFLDCKDSLEQVITTQNSLLTEVGFNSFRGYPKLNIVDLKTSTKLISIGNFSFLGSSLKNIYFPVTDTFTNFSMGSFNSLIDFCIEIPSSITYLGGWNQRVGAESAVFGNTTFAQFSFAAGSKVSRLTGHCFLWVVFPFTKFSFPESLEFIESAPFYQSYSITEFEISSSNPHFTIHNGILFSKNLSILYLIPPGRATDFISSEYQFTGLGKNQIFRGIAISKIDLRSFKMGTDVLKDYEFCNLVNCHSIFLPEDLKTIPPLSLVDVPNLKTLILPDSIVNISNDAVQDLKILNHLKLPKQLERIASSSCCDLPMLETIVLSENPAIKFEGTVFKNCLKVCALKGALVNQYITNTQLDESAKRKCISKPFTLSKKKKIKISTLLLYLHWTNFREISLLQ